MASSQQLSCVVGRHRLGAVKVSFVLRFGCLGAGVGFVPASHAYSRVTLDHCPKCADSPFSHLSTGDIRTFLKGCGKD